MQAQGCGVASLASRLGHSQPLHLRRTGEEELSRRACDRRGTLEKLLTCGLAQWGHLQTQDGNVTWEKEGRLKLEDKLGTPQILQTDWNYTRIRMKTLLQGINRSLKGQGDEAPRISPLARLGETKTLSFAASHHIPWKVKNGT
ncbi:hypothetical protein Cadr_000004983 [Camelus dromedarius]|uniref:Uncharacterized protein n=1 Tax=Camelus dromedarius TaxID=9838 RepID=A0A5N4EC14_CAMDR|nr:hypothetical protein Cadr_000004983 [Camelus dromedarius]